jgi:hypothetical protein
VKGPWTPRETSAAGQVFEFRLWAALNEQSRGSLHVFLPLADRGVDALEIAHDDGYGHLTFDWHLRSATPDPFAKYRVTINDLRARVTRLTS